MQKRFVKDLGLAALVSFLVVLPFAILDLRANGLHGENGRGFIFLFGFMWLLPTIFIAVLLPTARTIRTGKIKAHALSLFFRMACLGVIAFIWGSLLIDQLPCFLGVPNCD
jgi:hypothetical protein